mmetsp:Transcript_9770/g.19000  ORF Transcript_9770/g.19000 Transcript_9770/m.19000 type:complete len:217 (-) Transcript_9770:531-1181(-)
MNFKNDDLIWKIIGEGEFCSFKKKSIRKNFCTHKFNITGLCSKQSCPLANSKYATIIQKQGVFFLIKKNKKNLSFPNKIWKKIPLSRNFGKAIQEINLNLALWPKFFLYFTKFKLTKLTQVFIRFRISELKKPSEFYRNKKLIPYYEKNTREKAFQIEIEKNIETELLNRLNLGVYGKLYSSLPIHVGKKNLIQIIKKKKITNAVNESTVKVIKKI